MTNLGEKEIRLPISRQQGGVIIKTLLVIPLVLVLIVALAFAFYEGRKAYYDAQVREMCAKDGGVKVYETVALLPEAFSKWGMVKFYRPTQDELALGPEYIFKEDKYYYKRDTPKLIRHHYEVLRRSDRKLLGETTSYGRGGGDIPGPWHPSSYTCPDVIQAGPNALLKSIFISSKGD